jgi:LEA14-like dessication related protein
MEKKLCYGIVIIVVIIVIIAGFFISLSEPGVEVTDIRYRSVSLSTFTISFDVYLDIDNDNPIGATLTYVEADIYIDDQLFGTSYSEKEFEIGAGEISQIQVVLDVDNLPLNVINKDTIEVRVLGTAFLKVSFLDFEVPIDKTEVVNIG